MSSRPPRRSSGGFHSGSTGPADDSPAQTNLGLLLQRALEAAQHQQEEKPAETEAGAEDEEKEAARHTKLCADCWNALTFKDTDGRQLARCGKDLWVRPAYTYEELNNNRIRRWYGDCPEYDDSE